MRLKKKKKEIFLCFVFDFHYLIIFDRSKTKTWEEKIWRSVRDYNGHPITVWGM